MAYRYFDSKEDIILATIQASVDRLGRFLEAAVKDVATFRIFEEMIDEHLRRLDQSSRNMYYRVRVQLWAEALQNPYEGSQQRVAGETLKGIPASMGQYTGPVRVIMDESEFDKIQPGDVMVCPMTSPVWSVLFPNLGALVTDTGGLLSHPAIIAREYQIPAVVGTGNATSIL